MCSVHAPINWTCDWPTLCGARCCRKTPADHPAHNTPAMRLDDTVLYEEFVRARQEAMRLTDRYRDASLDAADLAALWEQVVRQTETAQGLLLSWLAT